jgi:type IV pilus assembly protein PilA
MLTLLRKRNHKTEEDGFTLIELMVVVLIIAILIAIAIPTFLGAQDRARDRGAQSDLRNAMTAAKVIATDDAGELDTVDETSLETAEGALDFGAVASTSVIGIRPAAPSADLIQFTKESASGNIYSVALAKTGEVKYCQTDDGTEPTDATFVGGVLVGCVDLKW